MSNADPLHVAAGVIKNTLGRILISYRKDSVHQGGLWEFPGGKLEKDETAEQALRRELLEELGIRVHCASPLIKIRHDYPQLNVLLDVWSVDAYSGSVASCEGQLIQWVAPEKLRCFSFPAANSPIITASCLPHRYAILEGENSLHLQKRLQRLLNQGLKLIQLRQKDLSNSELRIFLSQALPLCENQNAHLLINSGVAGAIEFGLASLHLTACDLLNCQQRPTGIKYLAASCHTMDELLQAQAVGADFAVLGSVKPTATHPELMSMGWQRFSEMVAQVNIPVFALGGMTVADENMARQMGGQGIAGISMFKHDF